MRWSIERNKRQPCLLHVNMSVIIRRPTLYELKRLVKALLIREKDLRRFQKKLKKQNHIVYIAKLNKKICGYIDARMFKRVAYIENIVILKKFQGRKISRKLYDKCMKIMKQKGIKRIKLFVYSTKKRAINFWEKQGFFVISTTKDRFGKKLFVVEKYCLFAF